jgi:3-deoxy-D-manno-octulosonic-acid transferase/tetraacyldisaccharide-1-P 4'-kinase
LKIKGIYFLYRLCQAFALPLVLLYFLYRGLRGRAYWSSLPQRFGLLSGSFSQTGPGAIWFHAVSVGEVLSSAVFLRRLRAEFPNSRLFASTSTIAGQAAARDKLKDLADGIFYAPVDYVFAVRRVLRRLEPSLVIVAETEIWPNLFREVKRTGAGLAVVNGRISDRAWPRYQRLNWFFRAVLPAADAVLAQTDEMGRRYLTLGARPGVVRTAGNFKYDFEARPAAPESPMMVWLARLGPKHVWIAASTVPPAAGDADEDAAVLEAYRVAAARHPGLLLIWAPRKPEHFATAAGKLARAGIPFVRRSRLETQSLGSLPGVLLLDSIGELSGLLACAHVVFMGGTLAARGGHNILEPALFAKPVITGPHMENFQAVADDFRAAHAAVEIARPEQLGDAVSMLLADAETRARIGSRALACAEARRGASAATVAAMRGLYDTHLPRRRCAQPWHALGRPLERAWLAAGRVRQAHAGECKIHVPVISVGNLSMGGTGKTPCVLHLAALLRDAGYVPAILTRGYARHALAGDLAVEPGAQVSVEESGDEPQIFIRSGLAAVGIGANRIRAAALLLERFPADVFLLDDGFQHVRLARDLDIVLVDALDPFGGGEVFPLGRLREPISSLSRADAIVITRSQFSDLAGSIETAVRRANPGAPVFHAGIEPVAWVDAASGRSERIESTGVSACPALSAEPCGAGAPGFGSVADSACQPARTQPAARRPLAPPPFGVAGAFCGLGNPRAFRRTLERLGVAPAAWFEFDDHHRYRPRELRSMAHQAAAAGATALVTTEKDAVNLCAGFQEATAPLNVYWLQVRMTIDREAEFLSLVTATLAPRQ